MRNEQKINQIVGIRNNELVILEYVFGDEDNFKGAVGYSMNTITQDYIDDRNDIDTLCEEYDYLWREAVQAGTTTKSLEAFINDWVNECVEYDYLYPSDDDSFRYETEELVNELPAEQKKQLVDIFGVMGKDYVTWQVSGCGRCFNADDKWDVIFRPDLVELIKQYEK